ncbi:MAG: SixA phosphatase family protein [Acidiferrobacterales bacterium]
MRLVLVRHAPAEERAPAGSDDERRLTAHGRRCMRAAARGLKSLIPDVSLIATSPLVRARQTAEILAVLYGARDPVSLPAISPGSSPRAILAWLRKQSPDAILIAVGHEPDLGIFASWMLSGCQESFLPFKKGAACLLEFAREPAPATGTLTWLLTPAVLRQIGI